MSRKSIHTLFLMLFALLAWQFKPASAAPTTDIPGGNIAVDTTWTAANSPYDVLGTVSIINGATLTIEAGVALNFNNAAHALTVSNGALIANGTVTDTIIFGSDGQAAGDWRGIDVGASGSAEISHCTITYAGANASFGSLRTSSSATSITDCSIRDGGGPGVIINGAGLTPTFASVSINGHANEAIRQSAIAMQPAYSNLTIGSNGIDGITIPGGSLTNELTLTPAGIISDSVRATDDVIPYRFGGNVTLSNGADLTIEGEADIRFNNSGHFVDVRSGGQLTLAGTLTNSVTLQSDSGTAGSWFGIFARSGSSVVMSHCQLVGAGSTTNGSLYLATSDATVEQCEIRNGDSHGVVLSGAGITPTLSSVAIISNSEAAVQQSTANMAPIYRDLVVSGNGLDAIAAGSGTLNLELTLVPAGTISDSTRAISDLIPYQFSGNVTIPDNASLTVVGKADIRFNNSGHFVDVRSGGQLTLTGTLTNPVTLQSDSGTAGSWYGIYARSGSSVVMRHCELIGAGSTINGSLYLETSDATIEQCTIRNGNNHGVVLSGTGITPTLRSLAIISNTGAALRQSTVNMAPIYNDLTVSGNGFDAIDAGSGSISGDITLVPAGVVTSTTGPSSVIPYRFSNNVVIAANATLTVTGKADLRFNGTGHFLDVRNGGALRLIGGSIGSVRLGSDAKTAGDWYGVYIRAGANVTLVGCEIGYAGSTSNGALYIESSDVSVSSCRIHDSSSAGIVVSGAQPTLDCNFIEGNVEGLINRTTATVVDATNNWWGDASGPFNVASNATGMGDSVSDGVLFDLWKAAPTAVTMMDEGVSAEIPPPTPYLAFLTIAFISLGLFKVRFHPVQKPTWIPK